jgi:ABC-type sulfate transport system substrate-binding protein
MCNSARAFEGGGQNTRRSKTKQISVVSKQIERQGRRHHAQFFSIFKFLRSAEKIRTKHKTVLKPWKQRPHDPYATQLLAPRHRATFIILKHTAGDSLYW